jgi:hypothetical protein
VKALKVAGPAANAELLAVTGVDPANPDAGSDKKKGGGGGDKKAKKGEEEPPPPELTEEEKAVEARLAVQDEILVRRLARLRKYAVAVLDGLAVFAQESYAKFAAAIEERVRAEAACISALSGVARRAVERKEVLPLMLSIDHKDVYRFPHLLQLEKDTDLTLDHGVRLLPVPDPPPVPEVEAVDEEEGVAFSPEQISALEHSLQSLACAGGAGSRRGDMTVTTTKFADAMHRLACDDVALPWAWQELDKKQFVHLAREFDQGSKGCVDGHDFLHAIKKHAGAVLAKCKQ